MEQKVFIAKRENIKVEIGAESVTITNLDGAHFFPYSNLKIVWSFIFDAHFSGKRKLCFYDDSNPNLKQICFDSSGLVEESKETLINQTGYFLDILKSKGVKVEWSSLQKIVLLVILVLFIYEAYLK